MNHFQTLSSYEVYVYTLNQIYSTIKASTLVLYRRGARTAILTGDIYFHNGCRLVIYERLQSETGVVLIEQYGYEGWQGGEKLYWYDSQPHPHISEHRVLIEELQTINGRSFPLPPPTN